MEDVIQSLQENQSDIENKTTHKEEEMGPLRPDAEQADKNVDVGNGNGSATASDSRKVSDGSFANCITRVDIAKEQQFSNVCARFPLYSEELGGSTLVKTHSLPMRSWSQYMHACS